MKFNFRKFTKIVLAVIGGNALYYSLEDRLPDIFHHKIFSWDWGLLLDFWLCVFLWVILDFLARFRHRKKP